MPFFILNPLKKNAVSTKTGQVLTPIAQWPLFYHWCWEPHYSANAVSGKTITGTVGGVQYHVLCITLHPTFLRRAKGLIWTTDFTWPSSPLPHSLLAHSAIETCSSRAYDCVDIPYVPHAMNAPPPYFCRMTIVIWLCTCGVGNTVMYVYYVSGCELAC